MPNIKPVAALVLFGAFFFRRSMLAVAALMVMMAVSDMVLGVYQWQLALGVYGGLAVAAMLGYWIKRKQAGARFSANLVARFAGASVAMSTAFFALSNLAVWSLGQWYPMTWEGLASCFSAAIPFYRQTLVGDLMFTGGIIAVYGLSLMVVRNWMASTETKLSCQ